MGYRAITKLSARRHGALAVAALAACFALTQLLGGDGPSDYRREDHRALYLAHHYEPTGGGDGAAAAAKALNETITVYISRPKEMAASVFGTDVFERYGSGRVDYRIEVRSSEPHDDECDAASPVYPEGGGPCLAVTKFKYNGINDQHDNLKVSTGWIPLGGCSHPYLGDHLAAAKLFIIS